MRHALELLRRSPDCSFRGRKGDEQQLCKVVFEGGALLCKERLQDGLITQAREYGPGMSGALFGAGWWFWVDACAASGVNIPFVQVIGNQCMHVAGSPVM